MISKIKWLLFLTNFSTLVKTTNVYNYYELAVQKWCDNEYNIHGLWPQINSSSYPEYCKSVNYTYPTDTLLDDMKNYWHGCDDSLWQHEWEKHGSCVAEQTNMDEYTFFNTTIDLFLNNQNLLSDCKSEKDDCILGCFDLDFNLIDC